MDRVPSATGANAADVSFYLDVDGSQGEWAVRHLSLEESISGLYSGVINAVTSTPPADVGSLLGAEFKLQVVRGGHRRTLSGVVRRISVHDGFGEATVALEVVPQTWRLSLGMDSRIFQETTIPQLVKDLIAEALPDRVAVDLDLLTGTYETHEYLVQYQESTWNFISRLLEREGIFCFLRDMEGGEILVLADSGRNLPKSRPDDGGSVAHAGGHVGHDDDEVVFDLERREDLAPTAVTLNAYDWTNPQLDIRDTKVGNTPLDPQPEVYDHSDVITLHRYGDQYAHNTLTDAITLRRQALDVLRQRWSMQGSVVTARVGHLLKVEGAPDPELDGEYVIVALTSEGAAPEGSVGSWSTSFAVYPVSADYRPTPETPRPVVSGPETAVVVGPAGQEIHTDKQGRVRVRFHWDRQHARGEEESSRWIRVSHAWAGAGFGTLFIPRIGMEVVVSFLDGDPERPLVTGCVYNGANRAQYQLPDEKTKSWVRTESTIGGDGFNELRFEDKKGDEEIWIHAEKDFNELVLHDHNTRVNNCQTNTVDVDQTELIKHDQSLTVRNNRDKTVDVDETTMIGHDRTEEVGHDEEVKIGHDRRHGIANDDILEVGQNQTTKIGGNQGIKIGIDQTLDVRSTRRTQIGVIDENEVGTLWRTRCGGSTLEADPASIRESAPAEIVLNAGNGGTVLRLEGPPGVATLIAANSIRLAVGSSVISMTASEISISSGTVRITGENQVLVNC